MQGGDTDMGGPARAFPTTRWSLIQASREGEDARRAALEHLFARYWKPLYVCARGRGLSSEAAKDAVQGRTALGSYVLKPTAWVGVFGSLPALILGSVFTARAAS